MLMVWGGGPGRGPGLVFEGARGHALVCRMGNGKGAEKLCTLYLGLTISFWGY